MSYRRSNPVPGGRRERRTRRVTRQRLTLQVGLGVAVASFAVGSIASAATVGITADPQRDLTADVAALPEIAASPGEDVTVSTETESVELKHGKVEQEDPNLAKGETKVVTEGEAGKEIVTYDVTTVGGEEVSRVERLKVTVSEPVDEVIAIGTMEEVEEPVAAAADSTDSGSGSTAPAVSAAAANPSGNRALGAQIAADMYGWTGDQWSCLEALWTKESGWNHYADNPYSSAYGIPQALPGSKMSSAGADWATNPATQIRWGLGYIAARYGTPCGAWGHSQSVGWY